jgi:hypothetical protein
MSSNCSSILELKLNYTDDRFLDFSMTGENFNKAAVSDEYFELGQRLPSVIKEIGKRL